MRGCAWLLAAVMAPVAVSFAAPFHTRGRLLQSSVNAMDEYVDDSDVSCRDQELLQYQKVHCSDDGQSLLVSVYNGSDCGGTPMLTAEAPKSSASVEQCVRHGVDFNSPYFKAECDGKNVVGSFYADEYCTGVGRAEVTISRHCHGHCVPKTHTGGKTTPCYAQPSAEEPIDGCSCHVSCGSCGYKHDPSGYDNCITCKDGLVKTWVWEDGTGTCNIPDTAPAQCFAVMGGEPIEACKCHPTCGSCGYNDWPVEENNCIACHAPNFLSPGSDGSGTCYPPVPPAPPPTASPTSSFTAAQSTATPMQTGQVAATVVQGQPMQGQQAVQAQPMQAMVQPVAGLQQMQQPGMVQPMQATPQVQRPVEGTVQPMQFQPMPGQQEAQAQQPVQGDVQPIQMQIQMQPVGPQAMQGQRPQFKASSVSVREQSVPQQPGQVHASANLLAPGSGNSPTQGVSVNVHMFVAKQEAPTAGETLKLGVGMLGGESRHAGEAPAPAQEEQKAPTAATLKRGVGMLGGERHAEREPVPAQEEYVAPTPVPVSPVEYGLLAGEAKASAPPQEEYFAPTAVPTKTVPYGLTVDTQWDFATSDSLDDGLESDSDYFFYYNNNPVFEDGDATPLDADVPITVAHIESVARFAMDGNVHNDPDHDMYTMSAHVAGVSRLTSVLTLVALVALVAGLATVALGSRRMGGGPCGQHLDPQARALCGASSSVGYGTMDGELERPFPVEMECEPLRWDDVAGLEL